MNSYDDSLEQSNIQYNQFHSQCQALLGHIDFRQQTNRQWVANCYRKLNEFISHNSKIKFNLSNESKKLPQIATKYAFSICPYEFGQGLQTFSKQMEESFPGKKKCEMPFIYKFQNNQWALVEIEDGNVLIRENNRFNLRIQAEEKSTIVVTYENNHPLRVKPELCSFHYEKATIQINPPQIISLVVVKQQSYTIDAPNNVQRTQTVPFKLPSNSVKIEVTTSGNKKGRLNQGLGWLNGDAMVRPEQTFEIVYSNSQGSQVHQYVGIETQSRSRD